VSPVVKVQLLLRSLDSHGDGSLADSVCQAVPRMRAGLGPATVSLIRVFGLRPAVNEQTDHGRAMGGGASFPVVVEVTCPDACLGTAARVAAAVARRVGPAVDRGHSQLLVGTECMFSPGDSDWTLVTMLARRSAMTSGDFHRYWRTDHGRLINSFTEPAGVGYRQFHADAEASRLAAGDAGFSSPAFEGTALGFFPSEATYRAMMSRASAYGPIQEDELRFMDHAKCDAGMYRTAVTVGPC
jgi:hypothetical protein